MVQSDEHIIEVRDLVKKFGHFVANDHISFSVEKGEIFGFLGANGAGKTTAMRILCGLLPPTSGHIHVDGFNVYNEREKIKKRIGYMSQRFSLYEDLTVRENIRFYGGIYGLPYHEIKERTNELIDQLGLREIQNTLIRNIPLGWRQKLAFSVAIIHHPGIVFLDEPTSGVDPITRRQFWDLIYEASSKGITNFVTTHYMDEAEYCDRVCILESGQIKAIGAPIELKEQHNVKTINDLFLQLVR